MPLVEHQLQYIMHTRLHIVQNKLMNDIKCAAYNHGLLFQQEAGG